MALPEKRGEKVQTHVTQKEERDWIEACNVLGIQPPEALRMLVRALATHVKEHGTISLPLRISIERKK